MATPQEPLRGQWVTVQREVANWAENVLHVIATTGQAPAWAIGYDANAEVMSIELGKAVGRQGFDTPDPLEHQMQVGDASFVPAESIPPRLAHRGSDVEAFIKRARDRQEPMTEPHDVLDSLLDDYRDHADTGTPLGEEVTGPHAD